MIKYFILFLFFLASSVTIVSGNELPVTNLCTIDAKIIDIRREWVAQAEVEWGDYFLLTLEVDNVVKTERRYVSPKTCVETFKNGKEIHTGVFEYRLTDIKVPLMENQIFRFSVYGLAKKGRVLPKYKIDHRFPITQFVVK
jgi:hypothetical protein